MEIANYKEMNPSGSIIAEFSAVGNGVTYHRLKLVKSKKGNLFISYPSYKATEDSPWTQYVEMSPERKIEFEKKVREALEPYVQRSKNFA